MAAASAAGILAERRWGERTRAASRTVLRVMLYGIAPVVYFFNVNALELDAETGLGVAAGWLALCATGAIAYGVARLRGLDRPTTGALLATSMQGNTGYLGLPLVVTLLGAEALPEAVVYDALVQTAFLLTVVFGVAAAFGTRAGEDWRARLKAFVVRNPPLLAVALGLVAPAALAPDGLVELSHLLVYSLVPLGFFAVGVTLAAESGPGRRLVPPPDSLVLSALGLRLLVAPALLVAMTAPLVDLPAAYLLLACMPAGINGLVVAHAYGLDLRLAAATIAYSTVVVVLVALVASSFVRIA